MLTQDDIQHYVRLKQMNPLWSGLSTSLCTASSGSECENCPCDTTNMHRIFNGQTIESYGCVDRFRRIESLMNKRNQHIDKDIRERCKYFK